MDAGHSPSNATLGAFPLSSHKSMSSRIGLMIYLCDSEGLELCGDAPWSFIGAFLASDIFMEKAPQFIRARDSKSSGIHPFSIDGKSLRLLAAPLESYHGWLVWRLRKDLTPLIGIETRKQRNTGRYPFSFCPGHCWCVIAHLGRDDSSHRLTRNRITSFT
jgi:hypothetical protein